MEVLAVINIGINPNIFGGSGVLLSWHGFFTFMAVATSVFLVHRWGTREGLLGDSILSVAVWAIIGGIVGARFVHVIDNWGFYSGNPGQIIAIWAGGIGIWGGILGGLIGGTIYSLIYKHPVGLIADITAPALLFVQSIGRLGDFVNGEHCANAWDFALGFIWTNSASDARVCANGIGASVHPVIAYEIIWNLVALVVIWKLRGRLRPGGLCGALYLAL